MAILISPSIAFLVLGTLKLKGLNSFGIKLRFRELPPIIDGKLVPFPVVVVKICP